MTAKYPIFLCPGPSSTPSKYLVRYGAFLGSSDIQSEFHTLYDEAERLLKELLHAPETTSAVIMSGEGMLALWAALTSVINAGDKVISINFGFFGEGIGKMAEDKGAEVHFVNFPANQPLSLSDCREGGKLYEQVHKIKPKLITFVHCETPTGTLLPEEILNEIGTLAKSVNSLIYADMVSSTGGVEINLSKNKIDLALIGSQKCFSLPPDLSIILVSHQAWGAINSKYENPQTRYVGYDSIYSFYDPVVNKNSPNRLFPYTMNWNAIDALVHCLKDLLYDEGIENVYLRHVNISKYFISKAKELGLKLFPLDQSYSSPTVTALCLPDNLSFSQLDKFMRDRGVVVGGSYGEFDGKLFRVGHMGSQANQDLIDRFLDVLRQLLECSSLQS